jgi:hypothetical protein
MMHQQVAHVKEPEMSYFMEAIHVLRVLILKALWIDLILNKTL